MFGKTVSELQSDIDFGETLTGTLNYVTGYTGYSSEAEAQEGNYLAFKVDAPFGAEITVSLVGDETRSVVLDEDRNIVVRVVDPTETLKVSVALPGYETTEVSYALSNLTLEEDS